MKSPARLLLFVLLARGIAQVAAMPASGTKHLTKTNHDDHTEAQNSPTGGFGGMTNHATATGTMGGTGTGTLSATAPATTTTAGGMPIYHGTKTPAKPRKRFSGGIIAAIVIGVIVVVIIGFVLYCCCCRKRHRKTKEVVVTVPGTDQSSQADCPEHKQGVDGYPASPMPIYGSPAQPASPPSYPNHNDNKSWMEYPNPVNAGSIPMAVPHAGYKPTYTSAAV